METCRKLEQKFNLQAATEKTEQNVLQLFRPVHYKEGNIKSQIASIVRYLPSYYSYQTFGGYNALLSLFNVTAEQISGELNGKARTGLVYFAINEGGEKVSHPFKSSLFGKAAGLDILSKHFESSKLKMNQSGIKFQLKTTIEIAMNSSSTEGEFRKQLLEQGINTVMRRNDKGRIFGATFIDHNTRTVWNGSHLSNGLSANVFNDFSKNNVEQEIKESSLPQPTIFNAIDSNLSAEKPHYLFDFLYDSDRQEHNLIGIVGSLPPDAQGEDYEELAFEHDMKRKKKKRRRNT